MHFTQATAAILATLTFSSTVFAAALKSADDFCDSSKDCTWSNPPTWPGVEQCSCNENAPAGTVYGLWPPFTKTSLPSPIN